MKLHPPIFKACVSALLSIFAEGRHAEKVVDYYLKNEKKWGARDRRLFAETVYDLVRSWRLYLKLNDRDMDSSAPDESLVKKIIEMYCVGRDNPEQIEAKALNLPLTIRESIPDWLNDFCASEIGADWPQLLHALNKPARQYLRVNTLKTNPVMLQKQLKMVQIETEAVPGVEAGLILVARKNVFTSEAFKTGLFEMQDGGSQLIAPFLQLEPGHRVVDACAGAGGKSLHIAALLKNKGQLIALDIHDWKLEELKKRARRAGVSVIETRLIENSKVIKRLHDSADRVLLDVPCSGLGVLRRHPDTKWKFSHNDWVGLQQTQSEILEKYSAMVKVGGKVVYATCSILPSENERQVQKFLLNHNGQFELEAELKVSPVETQFDGFYAARLVRKS